MLHHFVLPDTGLHAGCFAVAALCWITSQVYTCSLFLCLPWTVWFPADSCSNMPPADVSVLSRQLIVAGPQHLARHTVEEAAEAAERCAARTGQSYIGSRVLDKQQRDSQFEAQMELDGHFVQVCFVRCMRCSIGWA
jgi:hypothetical protein